MNYNYVITLHNRYINKATGFERNVVYAFMRIIRSQIAFKTNLCYSIPDLNKDCSITIPIDVLANDQVTTEKKLVSSKVKILKHFLEHEFNYEGMSNNLKAVLGGLLNYQYDYTKMLYISNSINDKIVDVALKTPTTAKLEIKRTNHNGIDVLNIYLPYMDEAMICLDVSRPYEEMGFSYNALHLFEHLLCSPWSALRSKSSMTNLNGFTSNLGNCFVYSLMSDQKTFKLYMQKMCEWLRDSRKLEFWHEHETELKRETNRTISETKHNPSYLSFARSPGTAYNYDYDISLFHYWSNQPMKLTIIHPFKGYDFEFDFGPMNKVAKPKIETFDSIPLETLVNSPAVVTSKVTPKEVAAMTLDFYKNGKVHDGLFGVDIRCRELYQGHFYEDDESMLVTVPMFMLSTFRDYLKPETLKQLVVDMNIHLVTLSSYLDEFAGSALHSMRQNQFMPTYDFNHLDE